MMLSIALPAIFNLQHEDARPNTSSLQIAANASVISKITAAGAVTAKKATSSNMTFAKEDTLKSEILWCLKIVVSHSSY